VEAQHPKRRDADYESTFTSAEGAALVRKAGEAEAEAREALARIVASL
jgi:hypothetical protein